MAAVEARMFASVAEPEPVALGRFELRDRVGEGGMGIVYGAWDPDLGRRVAIKVVRPGATGDVSGARLLGEARTLARITHPNVVTVLDAGRTGHRVWIAMEFVDETVAQWLQTAPPRDAVLDAFAQAGRGLAAAHGAGLVHRDFKPSNVLLRSDGRAVVADFGLAQLVDTDAGSRAGTPFYMSPEQYDGRPVGPRSDQFSFCVALYDALFEEHPYRGESIAERQVSSERGRLRRPADGELKSVPRTITAALERGLARDPADRYPSMEALLQAVFKPSPLRRRSGALVVGAATLGSAVFVLATQGGPPSCDATAEAIDGVWNPQWQQSVRSALEAIETPSATALADSVADAADRYTTEWKQMRVEVCEAARKEEPQDEVLIDRQVACLDRSREHLRAVVVQLADADASSLSHVQTAMATLPALTRCAQAQQLRTRVELPRDAAQARAVAQVQSELSDVAAQLSFGRYQEALRAIGRLRRDADATGYAPVRATALRFEGQILIYSGDPTNGARLLEESALLAEVAGNDYDVVQCSIHLIRHYANHEPGSSSAEAWYRRGEASLQRVGAPPNLAARLWIARAVALNLGGEFKQAQDIAAHAGELARASPKQDPVLMGNIESIQGAIFFNAGDIDGALRAFQSAEATFRAAHHDSRRRRVAIHQNMGSVYFAKGDVEAAGQEYATAYDVALTMYGPDSPKLADYLYNLGSVDATQGNFDRARERFERVRQMYVDERGPDHPYVAAIDDQLGYVAMDDGQPELACEHFERAYRMKVANLGSDHPDLAHSLSGLADATLAAGRPVEAMAVQEQVLALYRRTIGEDSDVYAASQAQLAEAAIAASDLPTAREAAADALTKALALNVPHTIARSRMALAQATWPVDPAAARGFAAEVLESAETAEQRANAEAWLVDHPVQ